MGSDSPRFSVVIPTRERSDTLQATLKTCVTQDYENLEIVVSDNFSRDNTREIVTSFNDPRIRYINTGRRVGMSTNWEWALSHVTGEYVTFIGDDDGFMPGAMADIARTFDKLGNVGTFVWTKPMYKWPDYSKLSDRNTLFLHLLGKQILVFDAGQQLRQVVAFKASWGSLSSIYNSFVNMELVNAIKRSSGGRFFNSAIPDIYSAIVIACNLTRFHYSMKPYTIAGVSRHSTGDSFTNVHLNAAPAQHFVSENDISLHPNMVMSSLSAICVAECFLQARDLGLTPADLDLDLKTLIKAVLREASEEPDEKYAVTLGQLRQIGVKNGLEEFVSSATVEAMHSPPVRESSPVSGHDLRRHGLIVDCSKFGVKDIYDATLLCERILNARPFEFFYPVGTLKVTIRSFTPFIRKRLKRALDRLNRTGYHKTVSRT